MLSYARGAMLNVELFSANTCDDELFSFELFHEQIGGYLELPLQGVLYVNALYPGRCPGLWKSCPFVAQWLYYKHLSSLMDH